MVNLKPGLIPAIKQIKRGKFPKSARRFLFVFRLLSRATDLKINKLDIYKYGWEKCLDSGEPLPIWDSKENMKNVEDLLKTSLAKCGCKKNRCTTRQCNCVRRGLRKCSVLCTCIDCNIKERDSKSNESKVKLNEDLDSDECSDNDDSDEHNEDDEDLDIENDKYFNKDTDSDYSDQEDNMLM